MFEEMLKEQRRKQINDDSLYLNYLCDKDVLVCNYVVNQLFNIEVGKINSVCEISIDKLFDEILNETKLFGDDIFLKTQRLLREVPIVRISTNDTSEFYTMVSYDNTKINDVDVVGEISAYLIPSKLDELSIYYFSHEQIHALKETNYNEYVDSIVLGEVISLFYELMIYNPYELLKKELLRFRISNLFINRDKYELFNYLFREEYINNGDSDLTRLYEYIRSNVGVYLNSFYYAVILYSMYKENPDKILTLVSKVLKHEMTTMEILNILGVYGDIKGELFEKELGKIKKIVK